MPKPGSSIYTNENHTLRDSEPAIMGVVGQQYNRDRANRELEEDGKEKTPRTRKQGLQTKTPGRVISQGRFDRSDSRGSSPSTLNGRII